MVKSNVIGVYGAGVGSGVGYTCGGANSADALVDVNATTKINKRKVLSCILDTWTNKYINASQLCIEIEFYTLNGVNRYSVSFNGDVCVGIDQDL